MRNWAWLHTVDKIPWLQDRGNIAEIELQEQRGDFESSQYDKPMLMTPAPFHVRTSIGSYCSAFAEYGEYGPGDVQCFLIVFQNPCDLFWDSVTSENDALILSDRSQ